MGQNTIQFSKELIKGKIAELVFEQMLREAGCFTILAFGYENILPELMHRQCDMQDKETMEIIRRAPDFAVINNETHDVTLIEVKYRRQYRSSDILEVAKRMHMSWKPSYLFLVTPDKFYFDKVQTIIKENGKIGKLVHKDIPEELQQRYLELLNKFIATT